MLSPSRYEAELGLGRAHLARVQRVRAASPPIPSISEEAVTLNSREAFKLYRDLTLTW